jgi:hypothetical protein
MIFDLLFFINLFYLLFNNVRYYLHINLIIIFIDDDFLIYLNDYFDDYFDDYFEVIYKFFYFFSILQTNPNVSLAHLYNLYVFYIINYRMFYGNQYIS